MPLPSAPPSWAGIQKSVVRYKTPASALLRRRDLISQHPNLNRRRRALLADGAEWRIWEWAGRRL